MSNMKKVTARQFQHGFGKLADQLKPGQTLHVTKHGKPHGYYTRLGSAPVRLPDFWANLQKLRYSPKVGDRLLKKYFDDSLS